MKHFNDKLLFTLFAIGSILFIAGLAILNPYILAIGGGITMIAPITYGAIEFKN